MKFILTLLIIFCCSLNCLTTFATFNYVEVIVTESMLLANPFQDSKPLFKTRRGNTFKQLSQKDGYDQVEIFANQSGWILSSEVVIPPFSKQLSQPIVEPIKTKTKKTPPSPYTFHGQENYRFPRRDSNQHFDFNIDGFYEVKVSGRDYSPSDINNPLWQTIINDPAYKKIPRDVLVGPMQVDFRSNIHIEGKLSEDLYVYYDIEQEPDMPSKYDVELKYKTHHLQFFNLSSSYEEGEFLNLNKSLRGAQYKYYDDDQQFQISMGKERSNSQVIENFGTGKSVIKLSHKFIYPGSVHVYVNHNKKKENSQYTVDYYKGEVTFKNPPQQTDYYKIIYEASSPIADYIPVLARRNFFGIQYAHKSTEIYQESLKQLTHSQRFKVPEPPTASVHVIPLAYSQFELIDSFSETDYHHLITLLSDKYLVVSSSNLSSDYSPEIDLTNYLENTPFYPIQDAIKDALDLVYIDYHVNFKLNSAQLSYSNAQLFPDSLIALEGVSKPESTEIWEELYKNNIINDQGFVRDDILSITTLFSEESSYIFYEKNILMWLQAFVSESENALSYSYILDHRPLAMGSEMIRLNNIPLYRNTDYFIDYQNGVIDFQIPLTSGDAIFVSYTYYLSEPMIEDLLGKDSIGPYKLSHFPVVDGSINIYLNNSQLSDIRDYVVDYDSGEIYFNFEVPYPSLISAEYRYILKEKTSSVSKKQPFDISATYVREYLPTDDEELTISVSSENVSVSNNIVSLDHCPLINTPNISISIDGITLSPSDYAILSDYEGSIEITNSDYNAATSAIISYEYSKSYGTKFVFMADGREYAYNQNGLDFVFRDIPFKYQGVDYLTLWDGYSEVILEEGTEYTISYEEDGEYIVISFLKQSDNIASKLTEYPQNNQRVSIIYDYTPSSGSNTGDIIKQMFGTSITAHLSDSFDIHGELMISGDNYSNEVLDASLENVNGTGIDNDYYSLGYSNIEENSEQVFVNGYSQTKDEDYIINYTNGTIRFRSFTPQSEDTIDVYFSYYVSGGTAVSGEDNYAYATKLLTEYSTPSLNIDTSFKYIDKEFDPIGKIQESAGDRIFSSNLDWNISPHNDTGFSFARHKLYAGENNSGDDIFLHKSILNAHLNNRLFNFLDTKNKFFYEFQLKDRDAVDEGDNSHDIDKLTYSYNGNYIFKTPRSTNTVTRGLSRSIKDYVDQTNKQETSAKTFSYNSKITYENVPYLNKISIAPKYYTSYSESTYNQAPTLSYTDRISYSGTTTISPFSYWTINANAAFSKINKKTSTTSVKDVNQSKSRGISSRYAPYSWVSSSFSYSMQEQETPLLDQKGDISEKFSANLLKLTPYDIFRVLDYSSDHYYCKLFKPTNIRYSFNKSASKLNNRRKHSDSFSNKWALNKIMLYDQLSIQNISISSTESNNNNYIEQSTVSENSSSSLRHHYQGQLAYTPKETLLKYFTYTYVMNDSQGHNKTRNLARSVTGNQTINKDKEYSFNHSLTYRSPQFKIINPINKKKLLRLGSGSITFGLSNTTKKSEEDKYDLIYDSVNDDFNLTDHYYEGIDNSHKNLFTISSTFSPFNIVTIKANYTSENIKLNRNKYNAVGTTYQEKKDYVFSSSYSPFSFITLTGTFNQDRYTQYKSPTINVSLPDIKTAQSTSDSDVFDSYINNFSRKYTGSITLKPLKKLAVSGSYSEENMDETVYKVSSNSDSDYDVTALSGSLKYTPIRDMSLSYTLTSQTINGSTGENNVFNFSYTPVQKSYSKVHITYNRKQTIGKGFNMIQQDNSVQGDGDYIKTEVISRNDVIQEGALTISLTYPIKNSPYIQNFVLEGEGYLKKVTDVLDSSNTYSITGLVIKGTLRF